MKSLPKILMALCVVTLGVGVYVSLSAAQFAAVWQAALPIGAILYGLCLISFLMQKETAQFDQEERVKRESAGAISRSVEAARGIHGLQPKPAH